MEKARGEEKGNEGVCERERKEREGERELAGKRNVRGRGRKEKGRSTSEQKFWLRPCSLLN